MKAEVTYNYLENWTDSMLAKGKYSFSLTDLRKQMDELSNIALKSVLKRLSDKGKIISIFKGYYLIIPPSYQRQGVLPAHLFMDDFMKYLSRPYYTALINAAAFHGAAHQQPQEFYVMTDFPVMRSTMKKNLKINYISIRNFPTEFIEKIKTEAGYLNVSSAVLTAGDLVQFEKRIGGLNRVGTLLNELTEKISPTDFTEDFIRQSQAVVLQRLGYLLEYICDAGDLAEGLYQGMCKLNIRFYRIPLKTSKPAKGYSASNRWKVIVNTLIEIDE